ncbi:hypothetical protein ABIE50_000950 [Chitinophaga sp. OAE865]
MSVFANALFPAKVRYREKYYINMPGFINLGSAVE